MQYKNIFYKPNNSSLLESFLLFLLFFILWAILVLILSYPLMLIWNNCLVNILTILNPITYWQMVLIKVFTTLMIGSKIEFKSK